MESPSNFGSLYLFGGVSQPQQQFTSNPKLDIGHLLSQIMCITSQSLDYVDEKTYELKANRIQPAVYQVLCELKAKTMLNMRQIMDDDQQDHKIARLDNMLMAEGISLPLKHGASSTQQDDINNDSLAQENPEYRQKISQKREVRLIGFIS
jgi:hypothetical protein